MTQTAKATILTVLATLQMSWITAEALLMVLGRQALSTLTKRIVGSRPGAAGLSTKGRWAWAAALSLPEGFQRVLAHTLLSALLLAIRG
jgi:hypothetical protein